MNFKSKSSAVVILRHQLKIFRIAGLRNHSVLVSHVWGKFFIIINGENFSNCTIKKSILPYFKDNLPMSFQGYSRDLLLRMF